MATESDGTKDIRSRQDEFFTMATAYFDSFVPGKVVEEFTRVITQDLMDADRLELEYPGWDFPRGGGGGTGHGFPSGPNMRQQWKFSSPPRVGETVTVTQKQVDKFVKAGIPWIIEETAIFGDDGRAICSNTGTWMLNGHRMGERWAKETEARNEKIGERYLN